MKRMISSLMMKTPSSKNLVSVFVRSHALLLSAVLLTACGSETPTTSGNQSSTDQGSTELLEASSNGLDKELSSRIESRVARILERVDESTVEQVVQNQNGDQASVRVPKPESLFTKPPITPRWSFLTDYYKPTQGTIVETFSPTTELPKMILLSDDAEILLLFADRFTVLRQTKEHEWAPEELLQGSMKSIQWNEAGTRLLVATEETAAEYDWANWSLMRKRSISSTSGRVQYSPTNPDALWSLNSTVDFIATSKVRSRWNVEEVDWDDSATTQVLENMPLADVGSFPQLKSAWALDLELGEIIPSQGQLQWIDLERKQLGVVFTINDRKLDYNPSADQFGNVFYLRANQFPRTVETPNVFAWVNNKSKPSQAKQLTSEPTKLMAPSLNGEHCAFIVKRNEDWILLYSSVNKLVSLNHEQLEFFDEKAQQIEEISEALSLRLNDRLAQPRIEILPSTLNADEDFFRNLLVSKLDLPLKGELEDLNVLDEMLDFSQGLWVEEPALIYSYGVMYGNILQRAGKAEWMSTEIRPELSYSLQNASLQPLLTLQMMKYFYLGLKTTPAPFDLHSPFQVARERLNGRLSFSQAATEAVNFTPYNTMLSEDFSDQTVVNLLEELSSETPIENIQKETLQRYLKVLEYRAFGLQEQELETAVKSSLEASENFPVVAENLAALATALRPTEFNKETNALAGKVVEGAGNDPELLYTVSRIYLELSEFDQAEKTLAAVRKWDEFGRFETEVTDDLKLISELRTLEHEGEQ